MKMLAHLTRMNGERIEQSLKEHCLKVAEYAAESVRNTGLYDAAYLAGLIHDMGKGKTEMKEYLERAYLGEKVIRGSVNHTFASVIWLFEKYHTESRSKWEKMTCEIIGYATGSHHGMFDCVNLDGENGFLHRLQKDKRELFYEETLHTYFSGIADEDLLDRIFQKAVQETKSFFLTAKEIYLADRGSVFFQISMLVRLLLSAVIYGDRRDTQEFMRQLPILETDKMDWKSRREYFETKIAQFGSETAINQVRSDISLQCLQASGRPPGIYRLNVPTGGGKTLGALRYALAHAEKYHKRRIIFIIPLLSILDQNAKVIKEYVPIEEEVLEHHSNVIRHKDGDTEGLDQFEYLAESWNYPIVVSTLVQLLEILFSHKTSAIGRMQALCDSVIVIDEVQTLPKKVTVMFNRAMDFLRQYCNATIVLSSATQPCFEELKWPLRLANAPDLVKLNEKQLMVFKRADVINMTNPGGMDWEECVCFCNDEIRERDSLLVICNTKAEAKILFEKLRNQAEDMDWDIYHLSTAMCQEHRQRTLEELGKSLKRVRHMPLEEKRKVICISTQLIEAGVDLSFECVIRVLAGIDNLAQAAGRCNRSHEYGREGKVYMINLKDENLSMLQEIRNAQNSTRKAVELWREEDECLISNRITRRFYQYLFEETKNEVEYPVKDGENSKIYLARLLSNERDTDVRNKNREYILQQPFKIIGQSFRVFDQNTIDILVPYEAGEGIIEQLRELQEGWFDCESFRKIMQQAKKYTVSIYEWQKEKLDQAGFLYPLLEGRVLVLDAKAYDNCFGLFAVDEQAVENFIL